MGINPTQGRDPGNFGVQGSHDNQGPNEANLGEHKVSSTPPKGGIRGGLNRIGNSFRNIFRSMFSGTPSRSRSSSLRSNSSIGDDPADIEISWPVTPGRKADNEKDIAPSSNSSSYHTASEGRGPSITTRLSQTLDTAQEGAERVQLASSNLTQYWTDMENKHPASYKAMGAQIIKEILGETRQFFVDQSSLYSDPKFSAKVERLKSELKVLWGSADRAYEQDGDPSKLILLTGLVVGGRQAVSDGWNINSYATGLVDTWSDSSDNQFIQNFLSVSEDLQGLLGQGNTEVYSRVLSSSVSIAESSWRGVANNILSSGGHEAGIVKQGLQQSRENLSELQLWNPSVFARTVLILGSDVLDDGAE